MANKISIKSRNELILENILGANNVLPEPISLTETLLTCWLNGEKYTDEIYDPSRNTSALLAIVNGTTYDATPTCEIEALLAAIANGTDPDEKYLPPKSRIGALLYEISQNKETQLCNDQKFWGGYTIGQTGNGRILKTKLGYQSSTTRIATIPESGIVIPASQVPKEGNIPPIDISLYKSIRIECDENYKIIANVFQNPSSTDAYKGISGWTTESIEYEVETGYKWLIVRLAKSNPDDAPISKEEFVHCRIFGSK